MFLFGPQKWEYMHDPPKNSEESKLLEILRNPKDWLPSDGTDEEAANKKN